MFRRHSDEVVGFAAAETFSGTIVEQGQQIGEESHGRGKRPHFRFFGGDEIVDATGEFVAAMVVVLIFPSLGSSIWQVDFGGFEIEVILFVVRSETVGTERIRVGGNDESIHDCV